MLARTGPEHRRRSAFLWYPSIHTPNRHWMSSWRRDKEGNIDRIMEWHRPRGTSRPSGPGEAPSGRARPSPGGAGTRYCGVFAEIDGVITRRNVNPGNHVLAGQSLMVVRSLTEIWIDANFKETQLADLKIGHRAEVEVDMYGSRKLFRGRITGLTMGTGQTLALLPPQNATGNFVKIVQRLPVRIELKDYDPETGDALRRPLGDALRVRQRLPRAPGAGKRLQELRRTESTASK